MTELATRQLSTALEVANWVRQLPIDKGADLIEQYARHKVDEARFADQVEMRGITDAPRASDD